MSTEHWDDFTVDYNSEAQGIPYDFESIMHYGKFTGTKNEQQVIVPYGNWDPGKLDYPSQYDYLHVNLLYCNREYIHVNI